MSVSISAPGSAAPVHVVPRPSRCQVVSTHTRLHRARMQPLMRRMSIAHAHVCVSVAQHGKQVAARRTEAVAESSWISDADDLMDDGAGG